MSRARDEKYKARRARERERACAREGAESARIVEDLYFGDRHYGEDRLEESRKSAHYVDEQGRDRIRGSFHDHSYRHLCTGNVAKSWQDSEDLVTSNRVWY